MFLHIDFFLLVSVHVHLDAAINQECSEYEENPVEAADDGSTEEDEDEAEDDGTEDSPVEYMLLLILADTERGEDHHHAEEVIYRQRFLYEITRDIGNRHIVSILL